MWRVVSVARRMAVRTRAAVTAAAAKRSGALASLARVTAVRHMSVGFALTGTALALADAKPKRKAAAATAAAEKSTEAPAAAAAPTAAAAPAAAATSDAAVPQAKAADKEVEFLSDPNDPGYQLRLRALYKLGNTCACHEADMKGPCGEDMFRCVMCMDSAMSLCTPDDMKALKAVHNKIAAAKAKLKADAKAKGTADAAAAPAGDDDDSADDDEAVATAAGLTDAERALVAGPNCMDLTEFVVMRNCASACAAADKCRAKHPDLYTAPGAAAKADTKADAKADAPAAAADAKPAKAKAKSATK